MNAGMNQNEIDSMERHEAFLESTRKHVLMITHGIHQWKIVPGLPDTGGQNVFVNHLSGALVQLGFRITIANRGGYPHPVTGRMQRGLRYKDEHQRILYLQDSRPEFVRKEEMAAQIYELVEHLRRRFLGEAQPVDAIISHYWDGARIGALFNRSLPTTPPHLWVPHSLGSIKKKNMEPARWADLRVDERIELERELLPRLDGVASTSAAIEQALVADYDYRKPPLFLPPCVDPRRYHPRQVADDDPVWAALCEGSGATVEQIRGCRVVTEISRTDRTKRKDVLLRAFASARQQVPDSFLVVTIDDQQAELAPQLRALVSELQLERRVAVLGSVWDLLPSIYALTDVYCTPSVMEGFGMSIQEAAATAVPAVSSDLVPFAVEYLRGPEFDSIPASEGMIQQGRGAMVVPADDVPAFSEALVRLLGDDQLRHQMGQQALQITIPYFTWESRTRDFIQGAGI